MKKYDIEHEITAALKAAIRLEEFNFENIEEDFFRDEAEDIAAHEIEDANQDLDQAEFDSQMEVIDRLREKRIEELVNISIGKLKVAKMNYRKQIRELNQNFLKNL
jgi:hypothetical protein